MNWADILLGTLILIWALLGMSELVINAKLGRWRYGFKRLTNSIIQIGVAMMGVYILIIGMIALPFVAERVLKIQADVVIVKYIITTTPLAYLVIVLGLNLWIIGYLSHRDYISFNKQEKQWRKETSIKFQSKLPKWLRSKKGGQSEV